MVWIRGIDFEPVMSTIDVVEKEVIKRDEILKNLK